MNGWQRIGVAVSILWAIGVPIYLMVDANQKAANRYWNCYSQVILQDRIHIGRGRHIHAPRNVYIRRPWELTSDICERNFEAASMTPVKMALSLMGAGFYNQRTVVRLWTMVLAPLILLWIGGWAVL